MMLGIKKDIVYLFEERQLCIKTMTTRDTLFKYSLWMFKRIVDVWYQEQNIINNKMCFISFKN